MENKTTLYGYTYEYLTRVFNEYKNENGSIDEDNLQLLVKQEFNKKLEKAEVKRLMLQIDQDGNGTLELDEFFQFIRDLEKNEIDEEISKTAFRIFDRDDKGYISAESVYHFYNAFRENNISLKDIELVFRRIKNEAEGEGTINYQDFNSLFKKNEEKKKQKK